MSNQDTTAHEETPDTGPIVEPKKIRGTHLVGITAIIVVVVVVGTYLLGRTTASTETRSADDERVLQAAVVTQAVEFGDFLLAEQEKLIAERDEDEDASDEDKELPKNLGYDDLLEDAGDDFSDDSDLAVQIHDIKDDSGLPVRDDDGNVVQKPIEPTPPNADDRDEQASYEAAQRAYKDAVAEYEDKVAAAEDESGDEIDDNSMVQVEIGFTSACVDLVRLEADGPSSKVADGAEISWVSAGPCPVESDSTGGTTTTTTGDTTTSTATEDGS